MTVQCVFPVHLLSNPRTSTKQTLALCIVVDLYGSGVPRPQLTSTVVRRQADPEPCKQLPHLPLRLPVHPSLGKGGLQVRIQVFFRKLCIFTPASSHLYLRTCILTPVSSHLYIDTCIFTPVLSSHPYLHTYIFASVSSHLCLRTCISSAKAAYMSERERGARGERPGVFNRPGLHPPPRHPATPPPRRYPSS